MRRIAVFCVFLLLFLLALAACATGAPERTRRSDAESSELPEKIPAGTPVVIDAPDIVRVWQIRGGSSDIDVSSFASAEGCETVRAVGGYDLSVPGDYTVTLIAENESGSAGEKQLTLRVLALPYDESGGLVDGEYETLKGFKLTVKEKIAYIDGQLIANKTYSLPSDYAPGDLLPEVNVAFAEMRASAPSELRGKIFVRSGYRKYSSQRYIYNLYLQNDSKEAVDTYSARPGHSEHQSGLAVDILAGSTAKAKEEENRVVFEWLDDNAWKYGFILRYPENKIDITGYKYEPWHYRYVGRELAEILYNGGDWITVEEYFGIDSEYKN